MIEIKEKSDCCGCSACVSVCPVSCIAFNEDKCGFRYPLVDLSKCIDCHLCEKVCPCVNHHEPKKPLAVFASKNFDESIRKNSSSGGIFTKIAEYIINRGGVVFGASFNSEWAVIHNHTETYDGIDAFRRSKYSQSIIGSAFQDALSYLKSGRLVLFSGTPCQIDGLKRFLRKDYDNLFTVEVVCHAVPSPMIWREYLKTVTQKHRLDVDDITYINFRDKEYGWKDFSLLINAGDTKIIHERCSENQYLNGFINNLIIRPSCFHCPSKDGRSNSDLSIADFWAINQYLPKSNDNKGITLLYINSVKGQQLIADIDIEKIHLDETSTLNIAYGNSTREKYPIDKFWSLYEVKGLSAIDIISKKMKPNIVRHFIGRTLGFLKRKLS